MRGKSAQKGSAALGHTHRNAPDSAATPASMPPAIGVINLCNGSANAQ
jgi:hypothetical protein